MRLKSWLWISALALFMVSVPVFALNGDQDQGGRPRGDREAMLMQDRSFPDNTRGYENNQREREWREYLKARNKPYKEWTKASREEQRDFDKYLSERGRDMRGGTQDQSERERAWREYLRQLNRDYRDYSGASRQEQEDFDNYLRNRNYQSGDQYGSWGSSNEPRNGACFYTDANYGGERFCLDRNARVNSVGGHFNDRISSIRIFGRARVTIYKDKNYGGSHRTYSTDAPHLGNFNDEVTSIEVR